MLQRLSPNATKMAKNSTKIQVFMPNFEVYLAKCHIYCVQCFLKDSSIIKAERLGEVVCINNAPPETKSKR